MAEESIGALKVREQLLSCTACALSMPESVTPVPFSGSAAARIAVLGEAPGAHENSQGEPFVGPAGRKVRAWLTEIGVDPTSVNFLNTVCCYPMRTPTPLEILACRDNLVAQLELLSPTAVLVLGNVALSTFWCSSVSHLRGLWFQAEVGHQRFLAMATYHPAYVLRQPSQESEVRRDLRVFKLGLILIDQGRTPVNPARCVLCGGEPSRHYDLLPLCDGCRLPEEIIATYFPGVQEVTS